MGYARISDKLQNVENTLKQLLWVQTKLKESKTQVRDSLEISKLVDNKEAILQFETKLKSVDNTLKDIDQSFKRIQGETERLSVIGRVDSSALPFSPDDLEKAATTLMVKAETTLKKY